MNNTNDTAGQIKAFILTKFPLAGKKGLKNTDSLLESGIVDSLGILEIVGFLEKEFGIAISDDELVPENFESIESLAKFAMARGGVRSHGS